MIYNNYNLDEFQQRLEQASNKNNLISIVLGSVKDTNIILLRQKVIVDGPKILIAGGFHGEEPAGPWSILRFLEEHIYPKDVNLAFLPMVNPTGFRLSRRSNFFGHVPNNAYLYVDGDGKPASEEDKILKDNGNILKVFAVDAFLTMHEDDEEKFYMFTLGTNTKLVNSIKEIGQKYFGIKEDGVSKGKSVETKDGIVKNDYDGSFEHFIKSKGCDISITVELPSRRDFEDRVNCGSKIIYEASQSKYY